MVDRSPGSKGAETHLALLKHVNHTGDEIRKDPCTDNHSNIWPRRSLPAAWWRWRPVIQAKWKHQREHINVLELRAILTTLKWKQKKLNAIGSKFFHLVDSAVCMGVVSSARSPSYQLGHIQDKANILLLASGMRMILAHVATKNNPADRPSSAFRVSTEVKRHALSSADAGVQRLQPQERRRLRVVVHVKRGTPPGPLP